MLSRLIKFCNNNLFLGLCIYIFFNLCALLLQVEVILITFMLFVFVGAVLQLSHIIRDWHQQEVFFLYLGFRKVYLYLLKLRKTFLDLYKFKKERLMQLEYHLYLENSKKKKLKKISNLFDYCTYKFINLSVKSFEKEWNYYLDAKAQKAWMYHINFSLCDLLFFSSAI